MDCQACGHPNPDDARFCGDCGEALVTPRYCGECGAAATPGQKFCTACGQKLGPATAPAGASPVADGLRRRGPSNPDLRFHMPSYLQERILTEGVDLEGERKQVTVLFADLIGSMELAGQVDAEEWRQVMDGFFALLCEGVHRFEGTVNKFTGDGIMALFGAPLSHEDHAKRACYAALHLRDELARYAGEVRRSRGLNFSVRMGLNSGEVVVGAVGDDLNLDYTAIGHTVGLASRMEQLAEPGRAYLTGPTAALVEGWFNLTDLGDFDVKGVEEPVRVFDLASTGTARTRVEVAEARGLSRFVGREDELAALDSAACRALESGGRVVGIVADPGLGKSRLCYEFVERCRANGYQVTEGRGVAHGKRIPLLPVVEMLRDYFGITDDDSDRHARDKIAGRLLLLDDDFKELLPVLFDFLGVPAEDHRPPTNSEARHRQLVTAVRRIVQSGGRDGPALVLIEDLHWLDPGSDLFLGHFVDALQASNTLLVVNFRPEYQADWMRKSIYQQMPLMPLGSEAIAELLSDLLGSDPSLDGLPDLIDARTGGNPFFMEEVVQGLASSGVLSGHKGAYHLAASVDQIAIPPTVQAVLAARIDSLPEREKTLLQRASVIGRDFSKAVLHLVVGTGEIELEQGLHNLVVGEFIFERSLYPEAEYSFKHPLTEEVAYRSQLAERRVKTHAVVAEAIAEVHADRLDEMAAMIANHWEAAKRPLESAQWNARAGVWAGKNHPADAIRHWRSVRSMVRNLPDSPESLGLLAGSCLGVLQLGGWRMGMPESELAAVYSDGLRAAKALGDVRLEAATVLLYALARAFMGELEEAMELMEAAQPLATATGDPELMLAGTPAYFAAMNGRLYDALVGIDNLIEEVRDAPELGRNTFGFSTYAWAVGFRGYELLSQVGRMDEASAEVERAIELSREYDDSEALLWALGGTGILAWYKGEPGGALANVREAIAISERQGAALNRWVTYDELAVTQCLLGEHEEAIAACEHALAILRESRAGFHYEPFVLAALAAVKTWAGDPAGAIPVAEAAVGAAQQRHTMRYELEAQIALARALVQAYGADAGARVEAALGRAEELVGLTGARLWSGWIAWTRADLAAARGDCDLRNELLRDAEEQLSECGATGWAARVAAQAAALRV